MSSLPCNWKTSPESVIAIDVAVAASYLADEVYFDIAIVCPTAASVLALEEAPLRFGLAVALILFAADAATLIAMVVLSSMEP